MKTNESNLNNKFYISFTENRIENVKIFLRNCILKIYECYIYIGQKQDDQIVTIGRCRYGDASQRIN